MIPEVVERRWYHFIFRHRSTILKALLLLRGGPRIGIITIAWYVEDAAIGKELKRAHAREMSSDTAVVVPERGYTCSAELNVPTSLLIRTAGFRGGGAVQ